MNQPTSVGGGVGPLDMKPPSNNKYVYIYVYIYVCVYVCEISLRPISFGVRRFTQEWDMLAFVQHYIVYGIIVTYTTCKRMTLSCLEVVKCHINDIVQSCHCSL